MCARACMHACHKCKVQVVVFAYGTKLKSYGCISDPEHNTAAICQMAVILFLILLDFGVSSEVDTFMWEIYCFSVFLTFKFVICIN